MMSQLGLQSLDSCVQSRDALEETFHQLGVCILLFETISRPSNWHCSSVGSWARDGLRRHRLLSLRRGNGRTNHNEGICCPRASWLSCSWTWSTWTPSLMIPRTLRTCVLCQRRGRLKRARERRRAASDANADLNALRRHGGSQACKACKVHTLALSQ